MRFHLTKKSVFLSVLLTVFMLFAVACGKPSTTSKDSSTIEKDVESVTLSKTSIDLALGETYTLTATVTPEDGTVLWNVSNGDSVITFDPESGVITAIGVGEASITAQIGYSRAECKVTVTQNVVEQYSISLNRTATQVTVGQQINLTATVRFGSTEVNDATIVWSVSEGDAVSVTQNGVVTAEKEGDAIVIATYTPNGGEPITAECAFGVRAKPASYKIYPAGKDSSSRYAMKNETFILNPQVFDADNNPVNFSEDELSITSDRPDVVAYLGDGRFRTLNTGSCSIRVEYKGEDGYYDVEVVDFKVTAEMMQNVRDGWTGVVTTREDGKLVYQADVWTGAVALTDVAFADIKQTAEKYGYTKMVATIYSIDNPYILNAFANGAKQTESANVNGTYAPFTEEETPLRWEVAYDTFKTWDTMQVFLSNGWDAYKINAVFTLTLEKYDVTAENQMTMVGSTLDFEDLGVTVAGVDGLTYADFEVSILNTDVLTYENGVFTAVSEGTATVCIEYGGTTIYANVVVLGDVYTLTADMFKNVANDWSGWVTAREDGKLVYTAGTWVGAVALTDTAFASVKQIAERCGYNLVATIYAIDNPYVLNVFGNGMYQVSSLNVNGTYAPFTEEDEPLQFAIDYETFKDWEAMQVFLSDYGDPNAVFTLTLEKYDVTAENQTTAVDSTIDFEDLGVTVAGVDGLTYADFKVTSFNPEILTYENGVFTTKAEGTATVCIDYKGCKAYVSVTVLGEVYTLTADMFESVGASTEWSWGGYISEVKEDGKMVYTSQHEYANGIALTDAGFASVKQIAETYGYTKLVVTIYAIDKANIYNIFNNAKVIGGSNVRGAYTAFTENDAPFRWEIDCATFEAWDAMQIFYSEGAILNAVFTLTLEKYDVTAENQTTAVDSTIDFEDLGVTVAGVDGLTYANFTVTSLNTDVLAYENGEFTAVSEGTATVCIDYKGCKAYVSVTVLGEVYTLTADMFESVGASTEWSWGGYISEVKEDGKMVYTSQHEYANGIALTDAGFASVKQIAETYGYTKLVVTIYAIDKANIYNIFNNAKAIGGTNVAGAYSAFTESDTPFRWEIDYATFKDWTAMQIFYSENAILNAVFTLTLEK